MFTFYRFLMSYRGEKSPTNESRLADWCFYDHDFPKHSTNYHEISEYLEWNSPFPEALKTFDALWEAYEIKREQN